MIYNKMVIGIDQSYDRCGISVAMDNNLKIVTYLDFNGFKNKIEMRKHLANTIHRILKCNVKKASESLIILERIRVFSGGRGANAVYLVGAGGLLATICDTAYEYNIPVYSVDTRAWKTQVTGTNKILTKYEKEIKPEKMGAIEHIEKLGYDMKEYNKDGSIKMSIRGKNKGRIKYIDDMADSACIALYGFIPKNRQKLLLEE